MLWEYLLHLKTFSLVEFVLQFVIFYNIIQIMSQSDFYYILAYFFLAILYMGLFLIFFDLDLICVILWVMYGGVFIIFFVYSLMWMDGGESGLFDYKASLVFFLPSCLCFLIMCFLGFDSNIFNLSALNLYIMDLYSYLGEDMNEELELMGWALTYYLTFIFLLISYLLFMVCLCSIMIMLNSKKIKYSYVLNHYSYLLSGNDLYALSVYKNQSMYSQDSVGYTGGGLTHSFFSLKNFSSWV